jgi:hypothetical protein
METLGQFGSPDNTTQDRESRISRREFLRRMGILIPLGLLAILALLFEESRRAEKQHLKGFWEIFSEEKNIKALKHFLATTFPNKNADELIERAYRTVLTEQVLLGKLKKILEMKPWRLILPILGKEVKSLGLGQISKTTYKGFTEELEPIKGNLNEFSRSVFGKDIDWDAWPENPAINFLIVICLLENHRKQIEEFLKKDNKYNRGKELIQELTQNCDRYFAKEDMEPRMRSLASAYQKLDELCALVAYSSRLTTPREAWVQTMYNLMQVLEGKEGLLKVDGDIGPETIKKLRQLEPDNQKLQDALDALHLNKNSETIESVQRIIYEIFSIRYMPKIHSILQAILKPGPLQSEGIKAYETLVQLISQSYLLQVGFHSLIDEWNKIKVVKQSYFKTKQKEAKFLEDQFHKKWLEYLTEGPGSKKRNLIQNLIKDEIEKSRKSSLNLYERIIKHLARVFIIRLSVLLSSQVEVPEQHVYRVGVYSSLGEKF